MALLIVISTGDFQIRWNVLSLSFSERRSGKWPLGLSNFFYNYLISNDCIQHSGIISVCNTYSLSPGVWQIFVTIRSCNHLMRIISTYVDNTKKSEIS